uniref:LRAT domain-containing protein n=1 Tax=Panagrolaimus sp. PS1159 TaxID=55785 RepID=A0AC35FXS6_9BILA
MVRITRELSYDEIPRDFRQHVENVLQQEWMGNEVDERRWGQTPLGQYFVLVTSKITILKVVWYAVRLIVDEEHRDLELTRESAVDGSDVLKKEQFLTLEGAQNFVREKHAKLEEGIFDAHVSHRIRKLPSDAFLNPDKYLKPGDHIQRRLDGCIPFINHEGIYIGDGQVCHINTETATAMAKTVLSDKREAHARIDKFQKFVSSEDQEVRILVHCLRRRSREDICSTARRLAEERYRAGEYNLLQQNCQHFASYCVLGVEWMSDKEPLIEKAMFIGSIAAIIGGAAYAIFSRNSNNNNRNEREQEQITFGETTRR